MSAAGISAAARVIKQRLKDRKLPTMEVPQTDSTELTRTLQNIQEHFRMYEGDGGAPKERFVTMAELEKAGLIKSDVKSGFAYISQVVGQDVAQSAGSTAKPTLTDPVKRDTSRRGRIPGGAGGGGGSTPSKTAATGATHKLAQASDVGVKKPAQSEFLYYDGGKWTNFPIFNRPNRWSKQQVFDQPFQMLAKPAGPEGLTDYGFIWTKEGTPTTVWFTDSAGSEWNMLLGGAAELTDLTDVNSSTPTNQFFLIADGVDWESRALVIADVSDFTDNSTNWDTAYTYSQVGHLPLAGGALTGAVTSTDDISAVDLTASGDLSARGGKVTTGSLALHLNTGYGFTQWASNDVDYVTHSISGTTYSIVGNNITDISTALNITAGDITATGLDVSGVAQIDELNIDHTDLSGSGHTAFNWGGSGSNYMSFLDTGFHRIRSFNGVSTYTDLADFTSTGLEVYGDLKATRTGAQGDAIVHIEGDSDNAVEDSNAILRLSQDGGGVHATFETQNASNLIALTSGTSFAGRNTVMSWPYNSTAVTFAGEVTLAGKQLNIPSAHLGLRCDTAGAFGLRLENSASAVQGYLYCNGSGQFGLLNDAGSWVLYAPTGSTTVTFPGQINPNAINSVGTITGPMFAVDADHGNGIRFWNSANYSHYMSSSTDGTYGGRIGGETTSDYNQYFTMSSGTNRGYLFSTSGTALFGINPDGVRSAVDLDVDGDITATSLEGSTFQTVSTPPSGSQFLRSASNGYTYVGWLNTVSGAHTSDPSRIYCNNGGSDAFVRYMTPANFIDFLQGETWDFEAAADIDFKCMPQMDYGIGGGYSENSGAGDFGATIWSLDTTWDGGKAGPDSVNTSVYGIRWLRGSHANAIGTTGEGLYAMVNGTIYSAMGQQGFTVPSGGDVTKTSHGNYLYHASTSYDNDQNGQITFGTGAASGGTTGDIHFQYTA